MTIRPQPGILDIAPYVGGASRIDGRADVLKLSANENPYGPPPSALAAMAEALPNLHRYPSTDHAPLREAIGEVHGLDPDRIVIGVGSDEVLQFIAQAYAGPGDEVIHTEHGFSLYPILAHAAGATPVSVPERERVVDVDAILDRVGPATRVVYLTNPGNPTGTRLPEDELARLASSLPTSCLLVLDGAYAEFSDGFDGGAALVDAYDNVVMTRTFSKVYGLGGLRVGWGYGPAEVIDTLLRIRQPFNMSTISLIGAEAAVRDRDFVARCLAANAEGRARLTGGLRQLGIACDDSHTNFVLARFADEAAADAAETTLKTAGIIVRRVKGYGFPEGLRITVGRPEDVDAVLATLRERVAP
ncbi:histidinol-phosphate transaminase [Rhodobacterales bacterium HKCCE3408]|nr:histidinol-phosphate transaminase [Rhodobacterales bacterium HKCCE3408]